MDQLFQCTVIQYRRGGNGDREVDTDAMTQ
jgi:hypothetical protein